MTETLRSFLAATRGLIVEGRDDSQREQRGLPFPLVLAPATDAGTVNFLQLQEVLRAQAEAVRTLAAEYGAILFTGFDIRSGQEWAAVLTATGIKEMAYVGGAAVRKLIVGTEDRPMTDMQILTTNESPPSEPIPFHHELAQTANPPDYICFYCLQNDATGGSTPLLRSDFVWDYIVEKHADFAAKIESLGVKYVRVAPANDDPSSALGRSWRSMYHVSTKEDAENAMRSARATWEWLPNDDCRIISERLPAVRVSANGNKTFFNQVIAAYTGWVDKRNERTRGCTFGDDSALPADVIDDLVKFMEHHRCAYRWSPGRFCIVDNTVAYHSRQPFVGRRRILAAIGKGSKPIASPTAATHVTLTSGARMPTVGLGCWKLPKENGADMVYAAIKAGYRLIDSACDYGNEQQTGEGIRRAIADGLVKREDLFIVSKLWNTFHRPEHVELAIRKTLTDLGLEYLDLYLIHFPIALKFVPIETRYPPEWIHDPTAAHPRMEFEEGVTLLDTWRAMEALVADAKLARHIGACNIGTLQIRQLMQFASVKPTVLQVEMHPELTQARLLRYAREYGLAVMAFSNLGASSYVELGMAEAGQSLLQHAVVNAVAQRVERTPAQVLLRWAVQRGTIVIPKTSKPKRLVENLSLFDFTLSPEDMSALDGLNANRRYNDPGHFCEAAFSTFCPIYD